MIVRLEPEECYAWLPEIWAWVGKLCETDPIGRISSEQLLYDLAANRKQAWLGSDGEKVCCACITGIAGVEAEILWTAGNALQLTGELLSEFERYAKARGCMSIETCGRAGWERLLKPFGYSTMRVILKKSI